jgi:hypothetical protein
MQLSTSSAALDLASGQSSGTESTGWSAFARHRPGQQSLPTNNISQTTGQNGNANTMNGSNSQQNSSVGDSPLKVRTPNRYSQDLKFFTDTQQDQSQVTSPISQVQMTPPKLQSSYSTTDVPVVKSNGIGNNAQKSHAQQHFHNHNASLGRIPPNAVNNRQTRDISSPEPAPARESQNTGYPSIQSALHASAPPFGPSITQSTSAQQAAQPAVAPPNVNPYGMQGYYNQYSMPMMAMAMQNMAMGPQGYPQNAYADYGVPYGQNGPRDSQARVIQQRRQNDGEGTCSIRHYYELY